jgi:hypothetical protein
MYIFIDESGIHKSVDNSTFVLVYIEIMNYPKIEKQIIETENDLKIDFFHWSEAAWKIKEKFIRKILDFDFKLKIAVIRNPVNPSVELEKILSHLIVERDIHTIFIDGKKPRWYERKIKKTLKDKGISLKKIRTVKCKQCAGIRLADLLAGLTRWYFDNKSKEKIEKYFLKIKKKTIVILSN